MECTQCARQRPIDSLRSCTAVSCSEEDAKKICKDLCADPGCTDMDRCEGGCKSCWEDHLPRARSLRHQHEPVSVATIMKFREVMGAGIQGPDAERRHEKGHRLQVDFISVRYSDGKNSP